MYYFVSYCGTCGLSNVCGSSWIMLLGAFHVRMHQKEIFLAQVAVIIEVIGGFYLLVLETNVGTWKVRKFCMQSLT